MTSDLTTSHDIHSVNQCRSAKRRVERMELNFTMWNAVVNMLLCFGGIDFPSHPSKMLKSFNYVILIYRVLPINVHYRLPSSWLIIKPCS